MTCTQFVEGFSEYYDGTAPEAFVAEAEAHLASCASCRRYRHVLERGAELLRSLPAPEVAEDFGPRLQHRLYHVDQDSVLRTHTSSGTTALSVLGMAVLLTAVAWSPALRATAPTVELEPIVVSGPPTPAPMRLRPASLHTTRFATSPGSGARGLWDNASVLLFQHSRLYQRYGRRSSVQRVGLEQDR